jgi:hypothetical protein
MAGIPTSVSLNSDRFDKKGGNGRFLNDAPLFARKETAVELSQPVKRILSNYESDNPDTKANLARILLQEKLGGTGRLLILQSKG